MNTTTENLAAALRAIVTRDALADPSRDELAPIGRLVRVHEAAAREALAAYDAEQAKPAEPVRVLVHMDGGLVQDVICDGSARVEVVIIDYDTDGADDLELTPIPQDGKYAGTTADACARITSATADPDFIRNAIAAIEARDAELEAEEERYQEQTP